MADEIDWAKLRARLRETPIVVKPKHVKHPNRSPESLEKRREGARARCKKHYWANREECLRLQKEWEKANPEKVKAKKHRYYEKHKDDPVFREKRAAWQKAYKARKKAERLALKAQTSNVV